MYKLALVLILGLVVGIAAAVTMNPDGGATLSAVEVANLQNNITALQQENTRLYNIAKGAIADRDACMARKSM